MSQLTAATQTIDAGPSSSVSWTQLQPGTLRRDRDVIEAGDLRIARRAYSLACRGEGLVAPGTALFGLIQKEGTTARWSGHPVGADDIAATGDSIDVCTVGPAAFFTLSVGAKTAEVIGFRRASLIRNPAGVARLRRYLDRLFIHREAGEKMLVKYAGEGLLRLVSAAVTTDARTVSTSQTRNRRLAAVLACQQYMLDHLERSVSLLDLANVSGLGIRSLFNAFEAVTGLSPMAYLRTQRLNRVRDVLVDPTRKNTRIIDVAGEWGFWHMGHFTNAYAAMFGETPSRTLLRAQSGNPRPARPDGYFAGNSPARSRMN